MGENLSTPQSSIGRANGTRCSQHGTIPFEHNERPFVAGLVLPNGVQVCRVCYERHTAKAPKEKTKRRRK